MTEKYNGSLKVKGVGMFGLIPVSHREKKNDRNKKRKKERNKKKKAAVVSRKKGTSIDVIA